MTRVGQRMHTCPTCRRDFVTDVLYSTTTGGLTSEFRRIAMGMQPEPYHVHTCIAALITERVTPLVADGPPAAWRRYEFAAWIAQWEGHPDDEVGYLYLCAAWCADDRCLPEDDASTYRRTAIEFYRRALDGDRPEGNERAELTYLVGELYRRVGDPGAADHWLALVAGLVEQDETGERLSALARRQRTGPSDVI
jgi:hypothetical protein